MKLLLRKDRGQGWQFGVSILLVLTIAGLCFLFSPPVPYKVVALILLVTVSIIAVSFDIAPVLISATLSAVIWDVFFIPPRFTFHISSQEDGILLLMYFLIALVNAVLTYRIRSAERASLQKEEKANTIKLYNTMLNSLSHELRTPIAAIIGATDNLQDSNINLSKRHRDELIGEIAKASFRLNQQVENLLNMSRLESGVIEPQYDWCDINETIYAALKRIEDNNPSQTIVVQVQPEIPLFRLDRGMLEQVIYNLVNNAVLYTANNDSIEVRATADSNGLQLIIADNGPGFPPDKTGLVFNKFYRLSNTAGGTGLGLSIVKGFAEAMGGRISLHNRKEGGALFTINIPAETTYLKNTKYE